MLSDKDKIRISAIIPTYNRAHLVPRAIESVLDQSLPPTEIIVIDDGSTDATAQQLAVYGDRVKYIYQENTGSAVARHRGMCEATMAWVALLDSDDIWAGEHLAHMVDAIAATSGAAGYYFADTVHPADRGGGSRWASTGFEISGKHELAADATDWVMMRPQPMMLQSTVFKRTAYLQSGGFLPRLRFRDDTHLFLKMGLGAPVCAVASCGARMTADDLPDNRLTATYDGARRADGNWMQVWMAEDLLTHIPHIRADARRELQRRLVVAHRSLARHAWHDGNLVDTGVRLGHSLALRVKHFLHR